MGSNENSGIDWLLRRLPMVNEQDPHFGSLIFQAKEIEKENLKKVWSASYENMRKTFGTSNHTPIEFEEYYNENFKK